MEDGKKQIDKDTIHHCMLCYRKFNILFKRKHTCKVCGIVVCHDCSRYKVYLLLQSCLPQRSCLGCYKIIGMMKKQNDTRINMYATEFELSNQNAAIQIHPDLGIEFSKLYILYTNTDDEKSFAISEHWFQKWMDFMHFDRKKYKALGPFLKNSSKKRIEDGVHPDCITNLSLLDFIHGGLNVKQNLLETKENALGGYRRISKSAWIFLYESYGGGPGLEIVSNSYWRIGGTYPMPKESVECPQPLYQNNTTVNTSQEYIVLEEPVLNKNVDKRIDYDHWNPCLPIVDDNHSTEFCTAFSESLHQNRFNQLLHKAGDKLLVPTSPNSTNPFQMKD